MAAPLKMNRELADKVRKLALDEYVLAIEDKEHKTYSKDFRNQLLLKLAGTVLPRLNEHTGEDGRAIITQVIQLPERKDENTMENQSRAAEDSIASQS